MSEQREPYLAGADVPLDQKLIIALAESREIARSEVDRLTTELSALRASAGADVQRERLRAEAAIRAGDEWRAHAERLETFLDRLEEQNRKNIADYSVLAGGVPGLVRVSSQLVKQVQAWRDTAHAAEKENLRLRAAITRMITDLEQNIGPAMERLGMHPPELSLADLRAALAPHAPQTFQQAAAHIATYLRDGEGE